MIEAELSKSAMQTVPAEPPILCYDKSVLVENAMIMMCKYFEENNIAPDMIAVDVALRSAVNDAEVKCQPRTFDQAY